MERIKILWLSNRLLDVDDGSTGTWLLALSERLSQLKEFQIANISFGNARNITHINSSNIEQWSIPLSTIKRNGLPSKGIKLNIHKIINDFKPHLIHVWGIENFWGIITSEVEMSVPILIEIQGLKWTIADKYFGELSFKERIRTIYLKEILKLNCIFSDKVQFRSWGNIERDIIRKHHFFSIHSLWAEAKVLEVNPESYVFKNQRMLRREFYEAPPWSFNGSNNIFTSLGYIKPFKGLYTLIKSIGIVKMSIPDVMLLVAGNFRTVGIRRDGYVRFIMKEIERLNLQDNVKFIGGLNAENIVSQLRAVSVSVFPSFVESYGLALAESMALGVPSIASYNGGYGYLGKDGETVLFFPPGDEAFCAFQIIRILKDENLQKKLSSTAKEFIRINNDFNHVLSQQINIYRSLLSMKI